MSSRVLTVADSIASPGATVTAGIVRFADQQPGGLNAWLDRPVRDGHGRPIVIDDTPLVDAHELVSF